MDALGLRAHSEYEIGKYIVDFFFPEVSLAIEVDGSGHLRQAEHDQEKDIELALDGIDVRRIPWRGGCFLLDGGWDSAQAAAFWVKGEYDMRMSVRSSTATDRRQEHPGHDDDAGVVVPLRTRMQSKDR